MLLKNTDNDGPGKRNGNGLVSVTFVFNFANEDIDGTASNSKTEFKSTNPIVTYESI